jgi:phospholipid/cholesterol/gamma-HCH transport system substrate-binding protein
MNEKRLELRVGFFVLLCLLGLAFMLIQFSKGISLFRHTYRITLNTANVGGLRPQSSVLMSGVKVGVVSHTVLSDQGTNVAVELDIFDQYVIRDDAIFKIEQSGFLGDQYVAIYTGKNAGVPMKPGAQAEVAEPFNLQEVAASANSLIARAEGTLSNLNETIAAIRQTALDGRTLTNFAEIVQNFQVASVDARAAVNQLNAILQTNTTPATTAVSNLVAFSDRLNLIGDHAQGILDSNAPQINSTLANLQVSSVALTNILHEVESGRGVAGRIINNEELAQNVSSLVSNLTLTSSELNRLGFFHWMFYKAKPHETNATVHVKQ